VTCSAVMRTKYVFDDFQQTYFVIESFENLLQTRRVTAISARSMNGLARPPISNLVNWLRMGPALGEEQDQTCYLDAVAHRMPRR
jgi:hypothetical protein